jgi:restriction system protein
MGYGTQLTQLEHTGASGDGGIDGVITLDRLGLEKVYVQAKRYAPDNTVGRPAIQGFFGALAGRRATKGVFITTSKFSGEAREFASTASDSIVLVNGALLADLMIDYGVGVSTTRELALVEVDGDFFDHE